MLNIGKDRELQPPLKITSDVTPIPHLLLLHTSNTHGEQQELDSTGITVQGLPQHRRAELRVHASSSTKAITQLTQHTASANNHPLCEAVVS